MRFLALTVLSLLIVVFLNPLFPYWAMMVLIAAAAALLGVKAGPAFVAGAIGMGVAWFGQSIYISTWTSSHLPDRMGELMGVGSGTSLIGITAVLGFLLGGFSALTGSLFRSVLRNTPQHIYKG